MTVYKPLKIEAESAAILAMKCAGHENVDMNTTLFNGAKEVPSLLIVPISVDASNMRTTVVADKFLKESEVYGKIRILYWNTVFCLFSNN